MRALLLMLALLGWAGGVCAQTYAVASAASFHFNRDRDYEERNLGFGIERRFSDTWSASTGFFKNSFRRDSVYVFGGYTPVEIWGWRTGAVFGAVSGYDEDRLSPWGTGLATRDFGDVGFNLVFSLAGVAVQVKLRIN